MKPKFKWILVEIYIEWKLKLLCLRGISYYILQMTLLIYRIQFQVQVLVKWIFENQHKLQVQTVRACSSSLRYKELEENSQIADHLPSSSAAFRPVVPPPRVNFTPEQSFKVSVKSTSLGLLYELVNKYVESTQGVFPASIRMRSVFQT